MLESYQLIPTVILLGVLVLIFSALLKRDHSVRLRLWFAAWVIIFLRFSVQLLPVVVPVSDELSGFLSLGTLAFSVVLFIASVSAVHDKPFWRNFLIVGWGAPAVLYPLAMNYHVKQLWVYLFLILFFMVIATYTSFHARGPGFWTFFLSSYGWALCLFSGYYILRGRIDIGFITFMFGLYLFCGILYLFAYKRWSPGVVTASAGFIFWASSAPFIYWNAEIKIPSNLAKELWNLPKFIVAIGMIVTLLEEGRDIADAARLRETARSKQLRLFADITSQLLQGSEVRTKAEEIVRAVADAAGFAKVLLILNTSDRRYNLAAMHGWDLADQPNIQKITGNIQREDIEGLCAEENKFGQFFYRVPRKNLVRFGAKYPEEGTDSSLNTASDLPNNDFLFVPLRAKSGNIMGALGMREPVDSTRVNAEDLAPLELLALDLAVAMESATLQQNLVRSEKLAGMGQLITGVAHELNNPLTAVLGHAELLGERATDQAMQRDLDIIRREALRMKHIIEDMARFSREQNFQRQSVDLAALVHEIVKQRSIDIHRCGAEVRVEAPSDLPRIMGTEMLLKQMVLNVLNNALDAMVQAETKQITIQMSVLGEMLVLRINDSGPGFQALERIFDPFYTTKSPGKGTGLGLSICYGIVRDHGGSMTASNLEPHGACVMVELPLPKVPDLKPK